MSYRDVRDVLCYTIHAITQSVDGIRDRDSATPKANNDR